MLTRSELPIAKPCPVDFNAMTRADATRRSCSQCNKHVHDLALMTEPEALELLRSPSTEGLCVRYAADARGKIVFLPDVPTARLTLRKRAALSAMALAAAALTTGCATHHLMGEAPSVPAAAAAPAASYELIRGEARISIAAAPGVFSAGRPIQSGFVSGVCTGDTDSCDQVGQIVVECQSTPELLDSLQRIGFSIVQMRRSTAI